MAEVEKEKKKSLWKHLVEQAHVDNAVLIALAKKFVPDMTKEVGGSKSRLIVLGPNDQVIIQKENDNSNE